ncbi:MAG: PhzF family phenazine biosynthesis protein [Acidobacteriota bacterium]|nr:MAG: PhzF family phenazine biosynthesis protein [Acidobacteriota bacterium]
MRKHEFYQLDVFTDRKYEGNPLAVFPDGRGISDAEMQSVAKEMNLSETVFVLPSERALRRLRIFTPKRELPLAGHPVVGTWNLLARLGVTENPGNGSITIEQEVALGVLPVEIEFERSEPTLVTMTQGAFDPGPAVTDEKQLVLLAESLGLERDELACSAELPVQVVSTGIRALAVPVVSLTALGRIDVNPGLLSKIYLEPGAVGCYCFSFETMEDSSAVHARFFAPADAIPEDPATGSAAGSLSGYLTYHGAIDTSAFAIEQGDMMGRPSRIMARVDGGKGNVERVRIGGRSVISAKGEIWLD